MPTPDISSDELKRYGGMPTRVLESKFTPDQLADAAAQASSIAWGYGSVKFSMPFSSPGLDWKTAIAQIAVYFLASRNGANPEGADQYVVDNYKASLAWLRDVAKGVVVPDGANDGTPDVDEGGPLVFTSTPRGW